MLTFRKLLFGLLNAVSVWILILVGVTLAGYEVVRPTRPPISSRQKALVATLTGEVRAWMGEVAPNRRSTALLTFGRDPFGVVSDPVRDIVYQGDRFDLADYSVKEKFLKSLAWTRPTVGDRMTATEIARKQGCEQVVWGTVREFSDLGKGARLVVDIEVVDAAGYEPLAARTFTLPESSTPAEKTGLTGLPASAVSLRAKGGVGGDGVALPGGAYVSEIDSESGWFSRPATRALIWILAIMAMPFLTLPLARRILKEDRNGPIYALLAGYVLASVLLCYGLFLNLPSPWVAGLVVVAGAGVAIAWHWKILAILKENYE
jgi:hypothetical protein